MLLEDVSSSRSMSSVDFGRAAQEARSSPKGLALPPPTEMIQAPVEVLDAEAALLEAQREKDSLLWRARVQLRRVSAIARELAVKTWELLPKPSESEELPPVEVSDEIDLDPEDQADTARVPTPVPFPAPRASSNRQWEVTTQVVDMTKRRKVSRPGRSVPIEDLVLEDPKKPR